jgi:hypothetical protein
VSTYFQRVLRECVWGFVALRHAGLLAIESKQAARDVKVLERVAGLSGSATHVYPRVLYQSLGCVVAMRFRSRIVRINEAMVLQEGLWGSS